jgi:murein DD-endopeptidase MepM/ murein hydrolase activator NlpD
MKKVHKIKRLYWVLPLLLLVIFSPIDISTMKLKVAFSSPVNFVNKIKPVQRPANLLNYEESVNTILNLVKQKGGKPVGDLKKTHLKKNETLSKMLYRLDFNNNDIIKIISSIQNLRNSSQFLSALPIGMKINYAYPSKLTGGALKLSFSKTNDIFVWQDNFNTYHSQIFLRPTKLEETFIKGTINSSLYKSAVKLGMPENTLYEMVRLLGFSVDFQREIRKGDSFEVMFTKQIDLIENRVIDTKPINFVSIILSGHELNFFEYKDKYGFSGYYDENGKSSKRTIMKTPINGARLSSKYGSRRHPVLGYTKMHRGIDFAAPRGTPVFAAGDGIVEKAGWNGSYGRYIRIRHTGTYKTAYAHLSGINKKVKTGKRVSQGKIIGYVGSSGRSTGAHLHYEVLLNNQQINPMRVKLPSGKNIPKKDLNRYKSYVKNIMQKKIAFKNKINVNAYIKNVMNDTINRKQIN